MKISRLGFADFREILYYSGSLPDNTGGITTLPPMYINEVQTLTKYQIKIITKLIVFVIWWFTYNYLNVIVIGFKSYYSTTQLHNSQNARVIN